jgi:outer membrane immunogenic protein
MLRQDKSMNPTRKQTSAKRVRETTMTNSILFSAVAALALGSTTALAADLPMKAPPPVVIYDWTGFYIGGSGGGSFGGSNHVDPTGANLVADGFNVKGGLIGGTAGYNWQMSSLVLGFEGDLSWVSEYGSHNDNNNIATGGASLVADPTVQSFTKETWLATARGRVGYAVNNLLFYGTAGYAGASVQAGIKSANTNVLLASATSTRSGWTAGGGLEWGFAPNWSAKFEWLYMKFDSASFNTALGDGPRSSVPLDDNVVRAGINCRFGGPVVARY